MRGEGLLERFFDSDRNRNRSADHRIVTHTDEAHHLNMSWNRRGTSELSVRVHTPHSICHTVRGRTCRHVIRMQGSTRATTGSNGEVLLTMVISPLLVGSRHWVLETRRIGRVTRDRDVDVFISHDRDAFGDVIRAITTNLSALSGGVGLFTNDFEFSCIVIVLGLDVSKTVNTANNEGGVLTQTI